MKKRIGPMRMIIMIIAFLLALPSCSPVYEHMPETKEGEHAGSEIEKPLFDEYFTNGEVSFIASYNSGIAYQGQWVYVEKLKYCVKEDDPRTPYDDSMWSQMQRIVKYNPVTRTVSSLCKVPDCMHSTEECLFCAPNTWMVSKIEIFGDWLLYSFTDYFLPDPLEEDVSRTYLYNLKTGEIRQLSKQTVDKYIVTMLSQARFMNGKIYSVWSMLDYTEKEEYEAAGNEDDFVPPTRRFVRVYDPETEKTEQLFEIPEDMDLVSMTNKRFIFADSEINYWSCDYYGNNLKREETIDFPPIMTCGQYAYIAEEIDYKEVGYNIRRYDLETDSISNIDFGCQISNLQIDSGKLVYTTLSNIDEFRAFYKNRLQYIKDKYPEITDQDEIQKKMLQILRSLEYGGTCQVYVTDASGENQKLVFEGENMKLQAKRICGDYLLAHVSYADPNKDFEITVPGNDGLCALNLETGEITLIPTLELYLEK